MKFFFAFFIELFILFLLSRSVTISLSAFLHSITKNKKLTILFIAILFFPGTLLHEISHYLTAKLLFVPTYGMYLLPKLEGDNLKLGSVSIAKTDFIRRLVIGMAPFFIGTTSLLGILFAAAQYHLFNNYLFIVLIGYALFEIGNTMFSSKKDMEGAIELVVAVIVFVCICYLLGFRLPAINPDLFFADTRIEQMFEKGSLFLLAPICIDLACLGSLRLFRS